MRVWVKSMRITPLGWLNCAAVTALFMVAHPYRDAPARWIIDREAAGALASVRSWRYLPDTPLNLEGLSSDPSDMLVVGLRDGDGRRGLASGVVDRLKRRPDGSPRLVLAYLPMSDARDPGSSARRRCGVAGAGEPRFWEERWRQYFYKGSRSLLSRALAVGFDGVYLGSVDVLREFLPERPTAERDMIDVVRELAATARRLNPDFLVVPENAEALLDNPDYRNAIDGFASDRPVLGTDDGAASRQPNLPDLAKLELAQRSGKPVFVVDYLSSADEGARARRVLSGLGFVPAIEARAAGEAVGSLTRENCETGSPR